LLVQTATKYGSEQFILLSTDKAVDPVNIMGASKRIAELILLAPGSTAIRMKAVRLGNVLGSEGSVVPLFVNQILAGGPITVTHPDARRYFLTTEDAVTLLIGAPSVQTGQRILVPELGQPAAMESLARHLIVQMQAGSASLLPIVFTGLRVGDKMCEALLSERESYVAQAGISLLRGVNSPALPAAVLDEVLKQLGQACQQRSLPQLLTAVLRAVPEYRPSALVRAAAAEVTK
jgi:FlaA1/EpsC-like NDP-sugar epimerase